jgi:hypothetical protein
MPRQFFITPPNSCKQVTRESLKSLYIEMMRDDIVLSCATGFVCEDYHGAPTLITNWHNLSGRNIHTNECLDRSLAIPNRVRICHNSVKGLGAFVSTIESVLDAHELPLWREHPQWGSQLDMVALPLAQLEGVELYPYDVTAQPQFRVGAGDRINVIGFPFGLRVAESFAVWSTGYVASEPEFDIDEKPQFFVDCRARQGQSGSPVIAHRPEGLVGEQDGETFLARVEPQLMGIYSGRLNKDSDLGVVWKVSAIYELLGYPVFKWPDKIVAPSSLP